MNTTNQVYLGRNKTKKRKNIFVYDAMIPVGRRIARDKYGKDSFSLFCFMALHHEFLKHNINFKLLLEKD